MPTINFKSNQPLTLTAQVSALINPTDTLLWEYEFVRGMREITWGSTYELSWDGQNADSDSGSQYIYEGLYNFETLNYTVDDLHPVEVVNLDTDELLGTLDSSTASFTVTVPVNEHLVFMARQTGELSSASVGFTQTGEWDTNGYEPTIASSGNQLTVNYRAGYSPCTGNLTARAKAYDGNGFLIATSADLTLTISGSNSGGC
ncbi:MAG: hypothetical protein ACOYMW_08070 [Candidatus Competibacteraceae bacterium]